MGSKEKLSLWMIARGFATGHGDSTEDLIAELTWQVDESLNRHADDQIESCVIALKKELHLWLPENRMQHIEDVCRSASLTKIGK